MTAVEHDAAAGEGPLRAVRGVAGGCVDAGAGVGILRGRGDEGVAAPLGLEEAEMRCRRASESEERKESIGEHFYYGVREIGRSR